jgi:hypothetical protein
MRYFLNACDLFFGVLLMMKRPVLTGHEKPIPSYLGLLMFVCAFTAFCKAHIIPGENLSFPVLPPEGCTPAGIFI